VTVTPLPGAQPETVLLALQQVQQDLNQARFQTGASRDNLVAYCRWVMNSASQLRYVLRPEDIDKLVLTRRQWALQAADPGHPPRDVEPAAEP
jgi:hypothetical protein